MSAVLPRVLSMGLLLLLSCRNGEPKTSAAGRAEASGRTAELFFTTSVNGYVEPCGCTTEPLGGLPRLASVVRGSPQAGLIDTGNLLFPPKGVDDVTREQHVLKAQIIARAYRSLGALAINLGESDLTQGEAFLKELQAEGATPFVSANIRPTEGGPVVARSVLRTVAGVKVGLTAVSRPELVVKHDKNVAAIEYGPVLRSEVKSLREDGAEVVILLANVGAAGAAELAQLLPTLDVILYGPGTPIERDPAPPKTVGQVVLVEAGSQGQRVGRLRLRLGEAEGRLALHPGGAVAEAGKARLKKKIEAYRVQMEAWKKNPAQKAAVAAKEQQIAQLQARLDAPDTAADPAGSFVRVDVMPLGASVPDDPAMKKLLTAYYQKLQKMNASKGDPKECEAKKGAPVYVGNQACVECHEEAMEFWKKTKHALAWKTLTDAGKEYDLTCVGCHVVGYREPGGFCRLTEVEKFRNVGCENCHGPGSIHVKSEDSDDIASGAGEQVCAQACHVPEHSDAFEYATYVKQITGEGHELSD